MEGMMAINMVEWNNDSIKTAEKACKEAEQIVLIKTIDVSFCIFDTNIVKSW